MASRGARRGFVVLLCASILAACGELPESQDEQGEGPDTVSAAGPEPTGPLQSGPVTVRFDTVALAGHPVSVEVDLRSASPRIFGVGPSATDGLSASRLVTREGMKVVLGSGFVSSYAPLVPIGLLKLEGREVSPLLRGGQSGIVGIPDDGSIVIRGIASADVEDLTAGLQVGPRLLESGENAILPSEPESRPAATRAFLSVCRDRTAFLGVTRRPAHLYHLAEWILETTRELGLDCPEAVNLSGAGAEVLLVRAEGLPAIEHGSYQTRQAALIAFTW